MLASTVQFSSYGQSQLLDRRAHPHPASRAERRTTRSGPHVPQLPTPSQPRSSRKPRHQGHRASSIPQDPTARLGHHPTTTSVPAENPTPRRRRAAVLDTKATRSRPTSQCSTLEPHPESERLKPGFWLHPPKTAQQMLLRKEVIQPHLPVRLPCYDFVPIADPTFDSSLSYELGHWLRVLPTFVT